MEMTKINSTLHRSSLLLSHIIVTLFFDVPKSRLFQLLIIWNLPSTNWFKNTVQFYMGRNENSLLSVIHYYPETPIKKCSSIKAVLDSTYTFFLSVTTIFRILFRKGTQTQTQMISDILCCRVQKMLQHSLHYVKG